MQNFKKIERVVIIGFLISANLGWGQKVTETDAVKLGQIVGEKSGKTKKDPNLTLKITEISGTGKQAADSKHTKLFKLAMPQPNSAVNEANKKTAEQQGKPCDRSVVSGALYGVTGAFVGAMVGGLGASAVATFLAGFPADVIAGLIGAVGGAIGGGMAGSTYGYCNSPFS